MHLLYRADGNTKIGLGHLFRLFALVQMLEDHEFTFVTKHDSTLSVFPTNYNIVQLPESLATVDEPAWLANHFDPAEHIIIADGYQYDLAYQSKLKDLAYKLIYVDDFASSHMVADVVINHASYIKESDYSAENYTQFALGTGYSLVRNTFIECAKKKKEISAVRKVFVCFGGSDIHDLTHRCVEGIKEVDGLEEIHVVVGPSYPYKEIYSIIDNYPEKLFLHQSLNEQELVDLMDRCDLAIIPTSTISYEACSVKMLILGGYYVDNQEQIYNGFKQSGILFEAGDYTKYTPETFAEKIAGIQALDQAVYIQKLENQHRLFDGHQKNRYTEIIASLSC